MGCVKPQIYGNTDALSRNHTASHFSKSIHHVERFEANGISDFINIKTSFQRPLPCLSHGFGRAGLQQIGIQIKHLANLFRKLINVQIFRSTNMKQTVMI